MKTVLVTGGAGSMGCEVAVRLASAGQRVRVFDLPDRDYGALADVPQVEIVPGDIRDRDALLRAAAGVDTVLHLAALLPPASERSREATMAVNVGGTANVLAALERGSPDAHLVLSSSVCVYGDTSGVQPPVRTSTPLHASDLYAESKIEAERLVQARGHGCTVLRISGVSVPAFLEPPPAWPFTADQRLEFVCRTDVVHALVACVEAEGISGKALNIAGGSTWRMSGRDYVARFNEVMGLPPEEARYSERPGYFDWYDTGESQAALGYQRTSFERFLGLLDEAIEEALGG
ncbi:MAG: NAD(P)-dependent oxidoreductase [Anaerolineae bacterium]|nr:NAD(P)-dependent oxidoreductase [Anaerolineae bacterium]